MGAPSRTSRHQREEIMKRIPLLAVGCLAMLLIGSSVFVQGTESIKTGPAEGAKPPLATFLIESPHTPEECLNVMDEVNKSGPKELASWHWGCLSGNHTGYRVAVTADA